MKLALQRRAHIAANSDNKSQEKINPVVVEKIIEVPVEKIVEKIVEVPVERTVFVSKPADAPKCLITVDKGSVEIGFDRPNRPVIVKAPHTFEISSDRPHRITVLEEETCWHHSFTETDATKGNVWLIKRG